MSKRTKQLLGALLAVIVVFGIYYFFTASSKNSTGTVGSDVSALSQTLPNGNTLDLKTLRDSRLQGMTPPAYPTVDRSEIGTGNPFK